MSKRVDKKTTERTIPPPSGPVQLPSVVKLLPIPRGVLVKLPLEKGGVVALPVVTAGMLLLLPAVVPLPTAEAVAVDG